MLEVLFIVVLFSSIVDKYLEIILIFNLKRQTQTLNIFVYIFIFIYNTLLCVLYDI